MTAHLFEYSVNKGGIERKGDATRLHIGPTPATQYSDAQLDDYSGHRPFVFRHAAPRTLRLRARFSHPIGALKGTAGFGFWNHPFGAGGGLIPRSLWFFYGSPESNLRFSRQTPGHGFKAALLDALPLWRRQSPATGTSAGPASETSKPASVLFKLAQKVLTSRPITALAVRTAQRISHAPEQMLNLDITDWHDYALSWQTDGVAWSVDGETVFRARRPPTGPLGLVIWIDNYVAQFTEAGKYEIAHVSIAREQWLEVEDVAVF